jgi:hypothetical protein
MLPVSSVSDVIVMLFVVSSLLLCSRTHRGVFDDERALLTSKETQPIADHGARAIETPRNAV